MVSGVSLQMPHQFAAPYLESIYYLGRCQCSLGLIIKSRWHLQSWFIHGRITAAAGLRSVNTAGAAGNLHF